MARNLASRLFGRTSAEPAPQPAPRIEWVDPAGLDLVVEWAAPDEPDRALIAEIEHLRATALPNCWLPFCRRLVIAPEGAAGSEVPGLEPFDPETVTLELEARGRIGVASWLELGRHCAELAPMPCTIEEWQEAIEADRRHASRKMIRRTIGAMVRMREMGIDTSALKGDKQIGARLNEIVNGGVDPTELGPQRDYLGDCMCLVAERAGYPVLDLRGEQLRSVTDHGGCRISRPSANERTMIRMLCLLMDAEISRDHARAYLEHSNPNRVALLGRIWPAVPSRAPVCLF